MDPQPTPVSPLQNKQSNHNKVLVLIIFVLVIIIGFLCYLTFIKDNSIENKNEIVIPEISKEPTEPFAEKSVENIKPSASPDVFVRTNETGSVQSENIVGYIFYGAFILDFPSWIADHWGSRNDGPNEMTFYPKERVSNRDFSDIKIQISTTTESFNSNSLYETGRIKKIDLIISEVFLAKDQETRIYHISRKKDHVIYDTFYLDGSLAKTATVTFSADEGHYEYYSTKIREIVQGLFPGNPSQG